MKCSDFGQTNGRGFDVCTPNSYHTVGKRRMLNNTTRIHVGNLIANHLRRSALLYKYEYGYLIVARGLCFARYGLNQIFYRWCYCCRAFGPAQRDVAICGELTQITAECVISFRDRLKTALSCPTQKNMSISKELTKYLVFNLQR